MPALGVDGLAPPAAAAPPPKNDCTTHRTCLESVKPSISSVASSTNGSVSPTVTPSAGGTAVGSREHLWHRVNIELRRGCYKSVLCKNFSATGTCPYLARCVFAHGQSELRIASQNFAEGLTSMEAVDRYIQRSTIANTALARGLIPPHAAAPIPAAVPLPYGVCLMPPQPVYVVPSIYPAPNVTAPYGHPLKGSPLTSVGTPPRHPVSPPQEHLLEAFSPLPSPSDLHTESIWGFW